MPRNFQKFHSKRNASGRRSPAAEDRLHRRPVPVQARPSRQSQATWRQCDRNGRSPPSWTSGWKWCVSRTAGLIGALIHPNSRNFYTKRYEEAAGAAPRAIEFNLDFSPPHALLAAALIRTRTRRRGQGSGAAGARPPADVHDSQIFGHIRTGAGGVRQHGGRRGCRRNNGRPQATDAN